LFPLFFLIVTLSLFSAGVISFTFFPNIQPDFFSIEAAYRPGDNKEQTERFVEAATMVLLEENERIQKEKGDTLLTYFSSTASTRTL
jgi:multidrug efflux pump subunit AcrB